MKCVLVNLDINYMLCGPSRLCVNPYKPSALLNVDPTIQRHEAYFCAQISTHLKQFFMAAALCALGLHGGVAAAQETTAPKPVKKHSIWASWGYNKEWYTRSNVKVRQESLGNDYTFHSVRANDHPGWDETSVFKQALTIPQYNYRLGYMIDEARGIGIELNFDHTKYVIDHGQNIHMTGQFNGRPIDSTIDYSRENGFYYYLNNGANFFLINFVKRWTFADLFRSRLRIDALGKAGIGPVVPHVENSFFGRENKPHFQLGGWNAGLEGDIKLSFFRYVYLEYGAKLDYARYSNLKIAEGTARQAFGTFEMILSLGVNVPYTRR